MEVLCSRNGFSAHQQQLQVQRREKKQKTIHYPVQTPLVQIVHSSVIQRQKCAVNAGKQRNWGVTYNERHLRGDSGLRVGESGGVRGSQVQQNFLQHCSNFKEIRNLLFLKCKILQRSEHFLQLQSERIKATDKKIRVNHWYLMNLSVHHKWISFKE